MERDYLNSDPDMQNRYENWIKKISDYLRSQKSGDQITVAMGKYLGQIGNSILLSEMAEGKIKEDELRHLLADMQNLTEILIEYLGIRPTTEEKFERLELHSKIARPTVLESGEVLL